MISHFEPNFIDFFFFFFLKVVFQILAEIEMTRNENRLFGRHFETVQILYIFSWNMVVISVYIWCKDN